MLPSVARSSLTAMACVLICAGFFQQTVFAASSFNPTVIANTEAFMTIDETDAAANVYIKFGETLAKTITYNRTTARFEFNDSVYVTGGLRVSGTASGRTLHAQDALESSGALSVRGGGKIHGTLSGNTITGFNLVDCQGSANKLVFDAANTRFSCAADQTGASSGITETSGDARYVNVAGDTMTGALAIKKLSGTATGNILTVDTNGLVFDATNKRVGIGTAAPKAKLEVQGAMSGTSLTVSGTAGNTFVLDGNSVVYDATNNRFGIRTSAPDTTLEVVGTMSGRLIHAQNSIESSGSLV